MRVLVTFRTGRSFVGNINPENMTVESNGGTYQCAGGGLVTVADSERAVGRWELHPERKPGARHRDPFKPLAAAR